MAFDKKLVSDFDGTMTQHDFYSCAVQNLLGPEDLEPWHAYTRGEITHFEALRRIFASIRAEIPQIERVLAAMEFDPAAKKAVQRLERQGWNVVVVSNGCGWYIERLFRQHNLRLELHTNPGEYSAAHGLQMQLPTQSPFFAEQFGISKTAVVRNALQSCSAVAFAGDGRPDLEPALMVRPEMRFARGWLATELRSRGETFQHFSTWSEISEKLCEVET
jgi:2-hydroxy-3-keto-5-methylthiopentenyl-1-phosphate phosphatase